MKKRITLVALAAVIVVALSSCGGNADTPESPSIENNAVQSELTANPTPSTEDEIPAIAIGDSANLGDWKITVNSFEILEEISVSEYSCYTPDDGNKYAVIHATIANEGKEMGSFLPTFSMQDDVRTSIFYDGDYEYSASVLMAYDADLHDSDLNPLSSKDGCIVFEIPNVVVDGEGSLIIVFSKGVESVTFNLR